LRLLADPSREETSVLGALRYQPNDVALHRDASLLPTNRRAWASWNYHVPRSSPGAATLTYWMNSLQRLHSREQLLVSLNRTDAIDPDRMIRSFRYDHPVFDADALRAQRRRAEIQGIRRTWYAGAYWGWGFHEDGVRSGLDVAESLGSTLDDVLAPSRLLVRAPQSDHGTPELVAV
jgi:predicted NAD/FAD-binding protein